MFVRFSNPVAGSLLDFERELQDAFTRRSGLRWKEEFPPVDVVENENSYELFAELPGVKKEEVKISLEDGILMISGERKQHGFPEGTKVIHHESSTRRFSRSFEMPKDADQTKIEAELTNGILRLRLPKAEYARPRQISIA